MKQGNVEMVVYLPDGGEVEVDLSGAAGELEADWFDPSSGAVADKFSVEGGGKVILTAPFGGHAVLYLYQNQT